MNIDGVWDFALTPDGAFPEKFDCVAAVPGCYDAGNERFGHYGIGWFRKVVSCGGMMRLTLRGGLKLQIYWDGKKIAASDLPFSPLEFDFDAGEEGLHTLVIGADNRVENNDRDQFHNFYDYYGFGGIYDHVDLSPVPRGVDKVQVLPVDYKTGKVRVRLTFGCEKPEKLTIAFDGGEAFEMDCQDDFELNVPDFKLWSIQTPNLHTISVNGVEEVFGIRVIECRGEDILVNGEKIFLVGYNRHESHPQFGYATPDHLVIEDLRKIKLQGCNFIRGCHYPQKKVMLDTCDRLGIMVWEEAMSWQNRESQLSSPEFCDLQEQACRNMVKASINHPCILVYGFLNECESDLECARVIIKRLADTIHSLDPSRPVTFASHRRLLDICLDLVDIISMNVYPGWYADPPPDGVSCIRPYINELAEKLPRNKPFLISEVGCSAIPGDHSGWRWSEDFQADYLLEVLRYLRETPRFSGVAFWHFCDARTYIYTQYHLKRPRGFNNKGLMNEYRIPKLAWRLMSEELKRNPIK